MSQTLIITGMHRSGTSLVANLLQKTGVNIGNDLLGPNKGNPRGHFEDIDFLHFHEKILHRLGQHYLVQSRLHMEAITSEERDEAKELIQRRETYPVWGWKDPRTSLFLDFWHELIPQANFLFVYRTPLDVVLSLLRRGTDLDTAANPLTGLRSWHVYNQSILEFYGQHQEHCMLVNIAGMTANVSSALSSIANKLSLSLQTGEAAEAYYSDELNLLSLPAAVWSVFSQITPRAAELYSQLEAHADLPGQMTFDLHSNLQYANYERLQRVMTAVAGIDFPDEPQIASAFTLLLATLDPQAVLAGNEALVHHQRGQIEHLEQYIHIQDTHLQNITAHANNLEYRAANDETRFQSLIGQVGALEQVTASKNAYIHNMEAHVHSLQQSLADKEALVQHLNAQTAGLEQTLSDRDTSIQHLQTQVASMEQVLTERESFIQSLKEQTRSLQQIVDFMANSKAWRLRNKWHAFRQAMQSTIYRPRRSPTVKQMPIFSQPDNEQEEALRPDQMSSSFTATPKVLFISHDAFRAGAQLLLLNLLKWLTANSDLQFEVLLKTGGKLLADFASVAPVIVWNESGVPGLGPDQVTVEQIRAHLKEANIRLIYANTITNGKLLAALSDLNCPVICHVHELEYWLTYRTEEGNNAQVKEYTTRYIAASHAVKRALTDSLHIPANQIDVVYEYIPMQATQERQDQACNRIRDQLQIPENAWIVGASGTSDWRKGPDLFIQLALAICARSPARPVHFVWVGGDNEGPAFGALWHDVERCGLQQCVHFVGSQSNPLDYFSTFDVFTLVSREDPFPVVNLEAASLAKPIVCFAGSGGAAEFVETDCGFVVPYLDIEAMADRVMELLYTPELRERFGQCGKQKVQEQYDVNVIAPKIERIVKSVMEVHTNVEVHTPSTADLSTTPAVK